MTSSTPGVGAGVEKEVPLWVSAALVVVVGQVIITLHGLAVSELVLRQREPECRGVAI